MAKRSITFGTYNTASNGWTLAALKLDDPSQKTSFVSNPGGQGSWDLSTALTDGVPIYNDRHLTVTLECSEGDRLSRKALIRTLVNTLDGMRVNIILPDDPDYYLDGRLKVAINYNDLAHASVTVTAVCDPWLYKVKETSAGGVLSDTPQVFTLTNNGRLGVVPVIQVSATATIRFGTFLTTLDHGTYQVSDIFITPGTHSVTCTGAGGLTFTFREAVLI